MEPRLPTAAILSDWLRRSGTLPNGAVEHVHIDLAANYTFDDLWLDYRRCVIRNLTIPIIFWSGGKKPEAWWHRLECALAAYRDLECDELL